MEIGWPSMAAFRLDAADAPAEHGEAVDHGGVAVGADQGVGIGDGLADLLLALDDLGRLLGRPHHLRQVLQVHLVADAGAGRHHAEIRERGLAPAQEGVSARRCAGIPARRFS
jgi:hypothetical protein